MTQDEMLAAGLDKRCRLLIVAAALKVDFEPDGANVEGVGLVPLPTGYRVRNKHVGGGRSTLPAGVVAYYVQHESFDWVEEGQVYPVIELKGW